MAEYNGVPVFERIEKGGYQPSAAHPPLQPVAVPPLPSSGSVTIGPAGGSVSDAGSPAGAGSARER